MVYRKYSDYLKDTYGEKIYKLPIGLPISCPNRDGMCGVNGCAFCGEIGAGYENLPATMTVTEQINQNRAHIAPKYKANRFIAYFQNFSNTYLPIDRMEAYVREACQDDVIGIALATRPDCINDVYLERLAAIREETGRVISVELGLQTVNYKTLQQVNRGHGLAEFIDAVIRLKRYGFRVCAHVIVNLPWDDVRDTIETAKVISALGIEETKLHALYVVKGTALAEWYKNGEIEIISKEEYMERVIIFLRHLHPDIVVQRLIGRAPEANTLFSNWKTGWWKIRDTIEQTMRDNGWRQGDLCDYLNGRAVKKFL